jgi:hypothetical protein
MTCGLVLVIRAYDNVHHLPSLAAAGWQQVQPAAQPGYSVATAVPVAA